VSRVLLVGAGAVGTRAARQLVETRHVSEVLVVDADHDRSRSLASAIDGCVALDADPEAALADDVDAVALASGDTRELSFVEAAIATGTPAATVTDDADALLQLLQLDGTAAAAGVTVAIGCGLAPGLADVMVRHAADEFDAVDEIRIARSGVAGPTCTKAAHRARRGTPREWKDQDWAELSRGARDEAVWFPEPVGVAECRGVDGGAVLLARAFPEASRVSYRIAEPPARLTSRLERRRAAAEAEWGSARVEVWGRRGQALRTTVYGVIERTAVAAGVVLALTAARLAGDGASIRRPGVHGLAELVTPTAFLTDLADRGVRIAVFEGTAAAS